MDLTGSVHLLLASPGQQPPTMPDSPWRMWILTGEGPIDPRVVAERSRVSPVGARAERRLVNAVKTDDIDDLTRLSQGDGAVSEAASVLLAGRLGSVDVAAAIEVTRRVLLELRDPGGGKVVRRQWSGIHIHAPLAPGVPALIPLSRVGLGLMLSDLYLGTGRPAEALDLLRSLPSHPTVRLALAATLLGNGEHERVLEVTTDLANTDDVSALALVARSVAARTTQDLPAALDAACAALAAPDRSPGVVAAALEERSQLYSAAQQDDAARADLEALAGLTASLGPIEVPAATPLQPSAAPVATDDTSRDRARDRMRRRILGTGEPGSFGGRHHSTYRDEIAEMFALGQTDAVEELLLGLLDAVEDEVAELGVAFDPAFFLTLADLYNDSGRTEDLEALRERYAAAEARASGQSVRTVGDASPGEWSIRPALEPVPGSSPGPSVRREGPSMAAPRNDRPDHGPALGRPRHLSAVPPPTPDQAAGIPQPSAPVSPSTPTGAPIEQAHAEPPTVAADSPGPPGAAAPDQADQPAGAVETEAEAITPGEETGASDQQPPGGDAVAQGAPDGTGEGADRSDGGSPDGAGPPDGAGEAASPLDAPRPLTPVERAVRGPRVRSL